MKPSLSLLSLAVLSSTSAFALEVPAIIRDFPESHPDFEGDTGDDREIVEDILGADGVPVYGGGDDGTRTTEGPASFFPWYRNVDGENVPFTVFLPLTELPDGRLQFESNAFFPIDNRGFGNEGHAHNYHFTTQVHLRFTYRGGETFDFDGDDDVYVFINKKVALNLGGVHGEESGSVDLDGIAAEFGLVVGQTYDLDLFHAERHLVDSNFKLTTSLALEVDDGDDGDGGDDVDDVPVDDNGDGVPDDQQDLPGDGFNDLPDENGDGVPDGCTIDIESGLSCPDGVFPDVDDDGVPDAIDEDRDGDGVNNVNDDDQDGDGVVDAEDGDLDGDGVANAIDNDIDGDGVRNADDDDENGAFVDDAEEDGAGVDVDVAGADEDCGCAAGAGSSALVPLALVLLRRRRARR